MPARSIEEDVRGRVLYAAHGVAYGHEQALREAQHLRPGLVCIRLRTGTLELAPADRAVAAILSGHATLEN